jgi:hypothetical protein
MAAMPVLIKDIGVEPAQPQARDATTTAARATPGTPRVGCWAGVA